MWCFHPEGEEHTPTGGVGVARGVVGTPLFTLPFPPPLTRCPLTKLDGLVWSVLMSTSSDDMLFMC